MDLLLDDLLWLSCCPVLIEIHPCSECTFSEISVGPSWSTLVSNYEHSTRTGMEVDSFITLGALHARPWRYSSFSTSVRVQVDEAIVGTNTNYF